MRNPSRGSSLVHSRVRWALLWVWAALGVFAPALHAQVRYAYLYSEIPPDRMFSAAPGEKPIKPEDIVLRPQGTHLSLINHVMTPTQPGAFITVTSSDAVALRQAAARLRNRPGVTGYIYRIRTDQSFYDVRLSLQHFVDQQRAMDLDSRYPGLERALGVLLGMIEHDRLFVTTQPIRSGMVLSATGYRGAYRSDGTFEARAQADLRNNWRAYQDGGRGPSATTEPYAISWPQDTSLLAHLWVAEGEPDGWVQSALATQCLTQQGQGSSHRKRRDAGESGCSTPPLIDLWQRLKIVAIMSAPSSGGAYSHDEL